MFIFQHYLSISPQLLLSLCYGMETFTEYQSTKHDDCNLNICAKSEKYVGHLRFASVFVESQFTWKIKECRTLHTGLRIVCRSSLVVIHITIIPSYRKATAINKIKFIIFVEIFSVVKIPWSFYTKMMIYIRNQQKRIFFFFILSVDRVS